MIEMLEKLLGKVISKRSAREKEEMNVKHACCMFMQDLTA